jgi:hypothetical protein
VVVATAVVVADERHVALCNGVVVVEDIVGQYIEVMSGPSPRREVYLASLVRGRRGMASELLLLFNTSPGLEQGG